MNKNPFSVSVIIPNWNGIDLLKKHLPKIIEYSPDAKIIVVDDCSTDESVLFLQQNFSDVNVIKKNKHEGYASTINVGVQAAKTDVVVLLNTDIEPEKGYLNPLVGHFSDPNVFAVGCMDKSKENGKVVLRGRGLGRWIKGFYIHKRGEVNETDTAWVSGGSGAFRRLMWNELGGMDPIYNPFYWEDIDLSYRAIKRGYKILFEPKSVVHHYHEKGKIKNEYSASQIEKIAFRNQFLFIWKHASIRVWIMHLLWSPVRLVKDVIRGPRSMTYGFIMAFPLLPIILYKRFRSSF